MFFHSLTLRALLKRTLTLALLAAATVLTGCANFYVDRGTPEISTSQYQKPIEPKPVQLLFEFQTKGVVNARATDHLKAQIGEMVKASGLFSAVESAPVAGGAVLNVTLNNVPLTDDVFTKGFVTGLTFGLAGSQVSDGYVCTVTYLTAQQAEAIKKMARHAIHTQVGAGAAPANGIKVESIEVAVRTMTRQIVSTALNELSRDPAFK
jgi:hypothetical protein